MKRWSLSFALTTILLVIAYYWLDRPIALFVHEHFRIGLVAGNYHFLGDVIAGGFSGTLIGCNGLRFLGSRSRVATGCEETFWGANQMLSFDHWWNVGPYLKQRTRRLDTIVGLDALQKSKPIIYDIGIRYFKYPNRFGTYDVVNLKTGRTGTDKELAPFYFR